MMFRLIQSTDITAIFRAMRFSLMGSSIAPARLTLFYLFIGWASLLPSPCFGRDSSNITLSILLYPWVPDYEHTATVLKQLFEAENPEIDLRISGQTRDYYEPNGLQPRYDIYELDGIFLHDFVHSGRIQPLNAEITTARSDLLKPASESVIVDGHIYAVPHWVRALYIFAFSHDLEVAGANGRTELRAAIGPNHEQRRGLLLDWKDRMALADLYAGCLLNLNRSPNEVTKALRSDEIHSAAKMAFSELLSLSDPGTGRSDVAHRSWPPFYAFEFAHARGRAFVGYSERMHHILEEIWSPTEPTPVIDPRLITAKLFNQGGKAGVPLVWVDSFAIDKEVSGAKLEAARKFLKFVMRDDTYLAVLLPSGKAPQYLLPAYSNVFADASLVDVAPLYPKLLLGLETCLSLSGPGLPAALDKIGELLDKKMPDNLQRR